MAFDCIVIGGGPAGMIAAITAARAGKHVVLLEKNDRLGKKLLITGKGRCNVTNNCTADEVLKNTPRNGKFLFSAMAAFPPSMAMQFFEDAGCALKTERGSRVFPTTDRSQTVLEALQWELKRAGVIVKTAKVLSIQADENGVVGVATSNGFFESRKIILATGGASYPTTGSTGDGYKFAKQLGHTIVEPQGSLVPLETAGPDAPEMQGLALKNTALKLLNPKGKAVYKDFGEMLFTHFGVSGPMVLSASAHIGRGEGWKLSLDLKPALEEHKLDERILRDLDMYQNRSMENALTDLLPRSMIPVVLRRIGVDGSLQANSFTKQNRRALVELLKNFTLEITGKRPVAEAIITSGGVKCGEIDPKTMESKKTCGLYFAGEIIDCDAYTGGFNLQIAWATGVAAGRAAAE